MIDIPRPRHLKKLLSNHCGIWIPVTKFLPPERLAVLVMVRGDDIPAYGWLKYAAGDKTCPYFVVPQRAAMDSRGCHHSKPFFAKQREDVTVWFSPVPEGLPYGNGRQDSKRGWGLGGRGWETVMDHNQ